MILIDIKSAFNEALSHLSNDAASIFFTKKLIIQIYHPNQLIDYLKYRENFHSYIFSLYRSHRKLDHICSHLAYNSIPHAVLSSKKFEHAKKVCPQISFIIHPVKSCEMLNKLINDPVAIGAMVSGDALSCK